MALGLASTTFGTTPGYDEPCECEAADPCYQAVYTLGNSICGSYETCEIPAACNGDREALRSVCACMVSETSIETSVAKTQSLGTAIQSIPSTIGATNQDVDSTATSVVISTTIGEEGPDLTAKDSGNDSATRSSSVTTSTGTKFETSTESSPAKTDSWSAPAGYGIISTKTETKATASAKTGTETSSEDVFTTLTETGGSYNSKASYSSGSYTTKTVYTTAVNIYTKCPDYAKDCSSGSEGFYTVTETSAISTAVYPITQQRPPMATDHRYTTKTFYTTELYIVTKCLRSVADCPYCSTTSSTYPVSTTVYRVPENQPSEPAGYGPPRRSTVYITKTVYSTDLHTVTQYGTSAPSCVCDYSLAETTPETPPPNTVVATGSEKSLTYSTDRIPDKVYDPALFKKSDAMLADMISSKSQPSAIVPYQQPSGTARGAEVTAGASRFGVHMAVAVAGMFAPII
ncbi:hypothetical protein FOPG_17173 [Fusarium oxysporum f. sp. conglutinans race 2 54008]|uniref:Uncharacterized protein n=2 Tax=Fusarium oxysporum f. sp. conglutinans TaxID=100902 RepID=A0A8H6LRX1_FUSOX|nr:hypothetical protein FOPG_17173 [Fusarium oxysporum f. sp. conglutinans race 2 54008]KAF6528545.1 hypothetical protein HZS61_008847 [Fusarium oxysporum f. sp. conglutinans]KAG6990769.1 hypothetical protein FocnCong_v019886 [Fusarium oxysporum f. sp. conglutinans]